MENYKINRNREPLTEEDIQSGQNFDTFMKSYSASSVPFYKTGTFSLSAVAVGVVIVIGNYFLNDRLEKVTTAETAFVQPALAGIDIADTTFVVDASKGGSFLYSTGSVIRIPEGGFLDSSGALVKGNVEIKYREFHQAAEIFISGIPMTYDSAGTQFHFESAGMLEITAWQKGKSLKANPAAPLKVAMATNSNEEKFNVYYLDTVNKNWSFIAKDKAVVVELAVDTLKKDAEVKSIASIVPPIEVKLAKKDASSFMISFVPKEFPELAVYDGVRFQVDERKTPYNQQDKNVPWEEAKIVRNKDGSSYAVTFSKGETTRTYMTDVVLDVANFAAAKKVYDEKYEEYQLQLKAQAAIKLAEEKLRNKNLLTADANRIYVNDTVAKAALLQMRLASLGAEKEDMIVREFLIQNFGIWNSDCPMSLPKAEPMFVKLIDSRTQKPMKFNHLVLIEKGRNAIYTYYPNDLARFCFNKNADNIIWAITNDGHLAVCNNDALQSIVGRSVVNLTMKVEPDVMKTAKEAMKILTSSP